MFNFQPVSSIPLHVDLVDPLCLSLSGLLGLLATELGLGLGLDLLLRAAEGGNTLNGVLAKVAAVAALGGELGNSLVGPVGAPCVNMMS